jgi:hypothetical protein
VQQSATAVKVTDKPRGESHVTGVKSAEVVGAVVPIVAEPRRRRRLTPTQKRANAAIKMRGWREARKARGLDQTANTPELPAVESTTTTGEPVSQVAQPAQAVVAPGPTEAERVSLASEAIAGTIEILAEAVKVAYVGAAAPSFGAERARKIADLWSPLLAPYLDARAAVWVPWALASGVTAQVAIEWRAELVAYKAKDARTPQAA